MSWIRTNYCQRILKYLSVLIPDNITKTERFFLYSKVSRPLDIIDIWARILKLPNNTKLSNNEIQQEILPEKKLTHSQKEFIKICPELERMDRLYVWSCQGYTENMEEYISDFLFPPYRIKNIKSFDTRINLYYEIDSFKDSSLLFQENCENLRKHILSYRISLYLDPENKLEYFRTRVAKLSTKLLSEELNPTNRTQYYCVLLSLTDSDILPLYLDRMSNFVKEMASFADIISIENLQYWLDQTSPLEAFYILNEWYRVPTLSTLEKVLNSDGSQLCQIVSSLIAIKTSERDLLKPLTGIVPTKILSLSQTWKGDGIVQKILK